ncbi:MAG: SufB/SufD family protein [Bacilli bacterium]
MNSLSVVKGFSNDSISFSECLEVNLTNSQTLFLNVEDKFDNMKINVEDNVKAKVFVTFNFTEAELCYEINVKNHANFEMIYIQKNSNNNKFTSTVASNALYNMFFINLSKYGVNKFDTSLNGEYAEYNLKTACVNLNDTKSEFTINTKHLNKVTSSTAISRSVILSGGKYVNNTTGFIEKGCSLSKCHQDTKAIVLGENAIAECDPVLLIDEYDVEASHAAAVGQINEDELYYMQSRGLSYEQCLVLLINGFLLSVTTNISEENMKDLVIEEIQNVLHV